ncbi:MAG: proteasome subunit beta [Thermosphaera sp.]
MEKAVSKTTTVGLIAGGYVILAADKRATAGPMVYHKRVKKIMEITPYSAMTISGLVADAQFIVENAKFIAKEYEVKMGKKITIDALANRISLILSAYLRYSPFIVQLLLGGVDDEGAKLYYMDLYGSVSREKYMSTGSGSPVAFGVLEQGYRDGMSLEEAKELAFKAVSSAIMRDSFTGEGVDILVIGPEGVFEETRLFKKTITTV